MDPILKRNPLKTKKLLKLIIKSNERKIRNHKNIM